MLILLSVQTKRQKIPKMYSTLALRTALSDPVETGFLMSSSHWKLNSEVRSYEMKRSVVYCSYYFFLDWNM